MSIELQEIQRYGRNKRTVINHSYINSGSYRKKFDKISNDKKLNRLIYRSAKEMLEHRSGTMYEDMYWIDINSTEIIAKETEQKRESKISYSSATKKAIKKYNNILTIHTHPGSMPPSIADFNSAYTHGYSVSLVCCHDGKVYMYQAKKYFIRFLHEGVIRKYRIKGYDEFTSQLLALNELQNNGGIVYTEVLA